MSEALKSGAHAARDARAGTGPKTTPYMGVQKQRGHVTKGIYQKAVLSVVRIPHRAAGRGYDALHQPLSASGPLQLCSARAALGYFIEGFP